jgi:hypothetical protein
MAELALLAVDNGDSTDYTYGADTNNPRTWDGRRIYGCHCDSGWQGYDCSLRVCPRGDDPGTYGQQPEVQLVRCQATAGTFVVSFRQAQTPPIPFDAAISVLEAALNALPTVKGGLSLSSTQSAPVCTTAGSNILTATFVSVFGDVPALRFDTSALVDFNNGLGPGSGVITVASDGQSINSLRSHKGTTENGECSNRGLCNTATGRCECFLGFSSSDGRGSEGPLGECGYRVPKRASYTSTYL